MLLIQHSVVRDREAVFLQFQDQSENTHDGDLYDDVITSRGDTIEEVSHRHMLNNWASHVAVSSFL